MAGKTRFSIDPVCISAYFSEGDSLSISDYEEVPFFNIYLKNGTFVVEDDRVFKYTDKHIVKKFKNIGKVREFIRNPTTIDIDTDYLAVFSKFNGENFSSFPDGYRNFVEEFSKEITTALSTNSRYKEKVQKNLSELSQYDFLGRKITPIEELDASPYKLLKELGRGKFGMVYLAEKDGKKYAIKMFPKYKKFSAVKKEYEFLSKASKAGIAPKLYGINEEKQYFVMEYLDKPFDDKMNGEVIDRIVSIVLGLDKEGIYYHDFHPGNFMSGKDGKLYLLDFGMARKIRKKESNVERLLETPWFRKNLSQEVKDEFQKRFRPRS